jgi:RNA-binding protein with serine-rich domain 1
MSERGRSPSPKPIGDVGMDVDRSPRDEKSDAKVVIVNNLTRNVVESHLRTIFGFYGRILKIDLPLFHKCMFLKMISRYTGC